ncbi:MAG: hypothetical protein RSA68_18885, partial [Hafnia sp.]
MPMTLTLRTLLLCLPLSVSAADLGVWGDVYPVQEQSMLGL